MKVLVVGGGAAGLMAAGAARRQGHEVTVLEHMEKPAQKILVTGKGRCNVTNACTMQEMIAMLPGNGKFLFGAFHKFTNQDMMDLLERNGLPLKVERAAGCSPKR